MRRLLRRRSCEVCRGVLASRMAVVGTLCECVAPSARRHGYVGMSVTCSWYTCHVYTHTQGDRHAANVVVARMPVLSRTELGRTALVKLWPPLLPASSALTPRWCRCAKAWQQSNLRDAATWLRLSAGSHTVGVVRTPGLTPMASSTAV